MFKSILVALVCAATVFISGCGGGGGGGGGGSSPEPVSISVSQQSVSVAATVLQGAPMNGFVVVTADHIPSSGLYVQGSYTTHGISSVSATSGGNSEYITFVFRSPSSLGVGVYTDTISLQVCRDSACTQQVTNSPQQITVTYTVTYDAWPTVTNLSPSTAYAGGSDFNLTVTGTGFDTSTYVYWNGNYKSTTYVSPTQLVALISASDIAALGTNYVSTTRSDNRSNPFNALPISVVNAPLSLTKLSPASVTVGNPAFVQTVIGTGFDTSSTVLWNGSVRPTTYVSTTELLANISAADVAGIATASVTATRTGSSASNAKTVAIVAPSIDATAFQINPQHNGAINFANIVGPSAFPLSSKWTASLNGPPSYALIAGGRVFATASVSGGGSELSAFSAATGARLWGPIALADKANATYDNGMVFVLTSAPYMSATLNAYDAASGTQVWSRLLNSQTWFSAPPTAANGLVYVVGNGSGGTVYAINQVTGVVAWQKTAYYLDNGSPTVTADGIYVTHTCRSFDFRPETGELVWNSYSSCLSSGGATVAAANGIVYAPDGASYSHTGQSFNAQTGMQVGTYLASATPIIGSQIGYFLDNGTLRANLLSTGALQWSFSGDGGLVTAPILVNNYVFVFSNTGNLYGLDATTGNQLWQTNMGGTMLNNFAMPFSGLSAGGGLLVVPVGNTLVAYTLSNNP